MNRYARRSLIPLSNQQSDIISSYWLEGRLKLTPASGQKLISLLIDTTRQDLAGST